MNHAPDQIDPSQSVFAETLEYCNCKVPEFIVIPPFRFAPLPVKFNCPRPALTN